MQHEGRQNRVLKDKIKKMRIAVLEGILKTRGATFLPIDIKQNILMGKSDVDIIRHIISKQSMWFKFRELYKRYKN